MQHLASFNRWIPTHARANEVRLAARISGSGPRPQEPGLRRPPGPGLAQMDGQDAPEPPGRPRRGRATGFESAGIDVPDTQRLADVRREDGQPRFMWRMWDPLDAPVPVYRKVMTRAIVERMKWRAEYHAARSLTSGDLASRPVPAPTPVFVLPEVSQLRSSAWPSRVGGANHV